MSCLFQMLFPQIAQTMITLNLYLHEVIEISVELFIIRVYFVSEKVTTYPFSVLKSFQSFENVSHCTKLLKFKIYK